MRLSYETRVLLDRGGRILLPLFRWAAGPGVPVVMELTPEGRRLVDELAQRHGVSNDAVLTFLRALAAGNGTRPSSATPS